MRYNKHNEAADLYYGCDDYHCGKSFIRIVYKREEIDMKKGMTRREREVTDRNEIVDILSKCKVVHLGLMDGDEPYVVAMNYGFTMEDEKLTLYLHGAVQGKKLDLIQENPKVFFEMECDVVPFQGKIACQYGTSYASVMGKGKAEILTDIEDKKMGLSIFMKTQTGKVFEFEDKMVSIVSVIRIQVSEYTAKRRPMPVL